VSPVALQWADELDGWLTEAVGLAEKFGLHEIGVSLRQLRVRSIRPGFRICVSGASASGKSQLINQLVGQEVLPAGGGPSPPVPVLLAAGGQSWVETLEPGKPPERYALDASGWAQVTGRPVTPRLRVRVSTDSAWLREHDIELLEVPGYDTLDQAQLSMVEDGLVGGDAVIVVTRVPGAFGLAERAFVAEEIPGGGQAAAVLVVVSRLDNLGEDAGSVVERIRALAAAITPAIAVLPGPGGTSAMASDPARLADLRAAVDRLASRKDRLAAKARQIAMSLAGECAAMMSVANEGLAATALSRQAREQARRQLDTEVARGDIDWDRIRAELERRRLAVADALRQRLEAGREQMVEHLTLQLSAHPNPKAFWEQQLPYAVRREISAAAAAQTAALDRQVAADAAWLERTVGHVFGPQAGTAPPPATAPGPLLQPAQALADPPAANRLELADPHNQGLWMRLGARAGVALAGAGAAATFAFPPLTILGALGGAVLGDEVLYRPWVADQRQKVQVALRAAVDAAINAHMQAVLDRTKAAYAALAESTRARQRSWQAARLAAVAAPGPEPVPWNELRDAAGALRGRIDSALNGTSEGAGDELG
jgi:hypothetical protein